ncbi:ATP-binding cassette domain-containing protein [Candidatus Bathyarchaeota archaeon]|nr:ATP-binding cassette domain-containing protein [Candidatus Bathyarchaeota archaeon]
MIEIRNLYKSFGDRAVLQDISLQAADEVFTLLGPNGAGKTTLVNIVCGLLPWDSGTVSVYGFDPQRDAEEVRRRIGLVTQETALYEHLTARENLVFHARFYGVPKKDRSMRVEEALEMAQLTDRADDRVSTFSGGMKRRLALVRALVHDPELLILDEPTLGVDVQNRTDIWRRIRGLEDKTVLLTTNYMDEADRISDRCAIINKGSIVALDSPGMLKRRHAGGTLLEAVVYASEPSQLEKLSSAYPEATVSETGTGEHRIRIPVSSEPERFLAAVSESLGAWGLAPRSLSLREPTLDDVFLELTGGRLRD